MQKIKKFLNSEFQHHHAFFLIIAAVFIFFSGNVFAYTAVNNGFAEITSGKPPSPNVKLVERLSQPKPGQVSSLENALPILRDYVKEAPVTVGIMLVDLETGDFVGENDAVVFESASMYKLFVAYETYRRIDLGIHSPSDTIPTESGTQTIEKCLEITITVSDNPCGRALRGLVRANVEPLPSLAQAGFVGTSLVNDYPTTSASDVALLFEKLYKGTDLKPDSNQDFLDNLSAQTVNDRIPAGLPSGLQVAHKTGDLEGYSHDGGIIYSPKGNYILVIMSGPWQNGYADVTASMSGLVSKLYENL